MHASDDSQRMGAKTGHDKESINRKKRSRLDYITILIDSFPIDAYLLIGGKCLACRRIQNRLLQVVHLEFLVIKSTVAPVGPSHSLDGAVGQGCRKERGSEPAAGQRRTSHTSESRRHVGLKPGRVGTYVGAVCATLELFHAAAFVLRIKGRISGHIHCDSRKDKKEGVRDERSGGRGEGEGTAKCATKDGLRKVVRDGQAGSDTNNVLGTGSPEHFSDRAVNVLVDEAIVHLERGKQCR